MSDIKEHRIAFIPAGDGTAMLCIIPADGGLGMASPMSVADVRQMLVAVYGCVLDALPGDMLDDVHTCMARIAEEERLARLTEAGPASDQPEEHAVH